MGDFVNLVKPRIIGTQRELVGLANVTMINVLAAQAEGTCYVLHLNLVSAKRCFRF